MTYRSMSELPASARCRSCGQVKPVAEMVVFRSAAGHVYLRPRCKACNNARERGHRRPWKRAYLRRWRRRNEELNRSYWQKRDKRAAALKMRSFRARHLQAARIQTRMKRHGYNLDWRSARELLREYGPAYPLTCGLSDAGRREMERRRSAARRIGRPRPSREIALELWNEKQYRLPVDLQPMVGTNAKGVKRKYA